MVMAERSEPTVRVGIEPGDIGRIVELHGEMYARELGWGVAFEAYVAEGLGRFVREADADADRVWIAEHGGRLVGSIAIGARPGGAAQLRYFLVAGEYRGAGLGRHLLDEALTFCRDRGYDSVFLWTAAGLDAAAHMYRQAGFRMVAEVPETDWGRPVMRQRYLLEL